jgi:hypothetical protein
MTGSVAGPKRDALPEGANWLDDSAGCKINKTCLDCPLAVCIDEAEGTAPGGWYTRAKRSERDLEIVAFWNALPAGTGRRKLAASHFGLSTRTISRAMEPAPEALIPIPQLRERHEFFKLAQPAALLPWRMP